MVGDIRLCGFSLRWEDRGRLAEGYMVGRGYLRDWKVWPYLGNSAERRKAMFKLYSKYVSIGEGFGHDLGGSRLGL